MFFFSILAVIVFGTIMYYVESGEFEVTEEYPEGVYLRWDYVKNQKEISPFGSILVSMYWAVVTTTTVGYGDFFPTTGFGRFLSCVYMYFGIIMLALPISVVGTNFQREYEIHYPDYIEKELKRQKQRAALGHVIPNPLHTQAEGGLAGMDVELKAIVKSSEEHAESGIETGKIKITGDGDTSGNRDDLHEKISAMDLKLSFLIDEIRGLKKELLLAKGDGGGGSSGRGTDDQKKVEAY